MKVWELKEGKEYISNAWFDDETTKYKIIDGELHYSNPTVNYGEYGESSMEYNLVSRLDFTLYTPHTDWSKVNVDTKVLVRDWDNSEWIPRHFAQYKNGRIYTWNNGHTSFTSRGEDDYVHYNQGKLYKEE